MLEYQFELGDELAGAALEDEAAATSHWIALQLFLEELAKTRGELGVVLYFLCGQSDVHATRHTNHHSHTLLPKHFSTCRPRGADRDP